MIDSYIEKTEWVNGTSINYIDEGSGEVILFLHHGGGFWQTWEHQLLQFEKSNRVIAFDWPSHGGSGNSDTVDLPTLRYYLDAFVEQLGLGRFHLVAHCIGASVALSYAEDHPRRLKSIALLNVCPGDRFVKHDVYSKVLGQMRARRTLFKIGSHILSGVFMLFYVKPRRYPALLFGPGMKRSDRMYQRFRDKIRSGKQRRALFRLLVGVESFSLDRYYEGKSKVDLLVWGEKNKVSGLESDGHFFRQRIEQNKFVVMDGTGHLSQYESPEKLNQLLGELIQNRNSR